MENIALIGIDLGKNSFHIHCQDRRGKAVYRKKFTRPKLIEFLATCPATTIAMEACGGSHFMARKLEELGHSPKLISPQFVRPFVKSNKNDFVDAEAICEAASRPSMRFVQPRTESQQAMRALHRVRESLVQDKVKTTNQMHAFLLEFGISVPRGAAVISRLSTILEDNSLPLYLSQLLLKLQQHYHYLVEQIKDLESQLKRKLDEDEVGQRLLSIPCVGTLTASTISLRLATGSSTPAAVTLRRQQGLYLGSTAREVGRHCWELVSEVIKRSELCWFNVPGYSYKNWNTSLANWPIGSGIYCAGKATLSSLVLWQTSWPE